jgi:hypothetical protein
VGEFLRKAFAANLPWDRLVREILAAAAHRDGTDPAAAFFIAKRLENYGQNPSTIPALTRDVGRLFLGIDLRCAQCHDHLFIADYKQGTSRAWPRSSRMRPSRTPRPRPSPRSRRRRSWNTPRSSTRSRRQTGPRIPGAAEVEIPAVPKGQEYAVPAGPEDESPGVPRFSPLATLAERLPTPETPGFTRNIVNRLWFAMMGRGLVHPPDLHHGDNPPSHPELLDLLSREFEAHRYDIKWLLRELALCRTYQRSSLLPEGVDDLPPDCFLTANERRLSAEQLFWSTLEATGERPRIAAEGADATRAAFVKAFANAPGSRRRSSTPP